MKKQTPINVPGESLSIPTETISKETKYKDSIEIREPKEDEPSSVTDSGIVIKLNQEEDIKILDLAKNGSCSPPADMFLHRQALLYSLNTGFDNLLSLTTVRNVELLDYQLHTVRHVLKVLRGRALLCDEVGLGKTIEAGLVMMEYIIRGLARRVLILAPPSLVEQWHEEMRSKFNLNFITHDNAEFKSHEQPWLEFTHIIASIDTAKRDNHRQKVLEAEYDLVIVDEAHHLKNHKSMSYKLVEQIKKKYILLLTATPVENHLEELFNLINLLMPGQLETLYAFKRKHITRGNPLKPKNTETLKKLICEVMIRNRRSETGVINSRRYAEVVNLRLSREEYSLYEQISTFIRRCFRENNKGNKAANINQFTLKILQRELGSSIKTVIPTLKKMAENPNHDTAIRDKLLELAKKAETTANTNKRASKEEALLKILSRIPGKVIIFTSFKETQQTVYQLLKDEGYIVAQLHGGMRRLEKEKQVKLLADEAKVLVSTETGSEGRNFQFCQSIINYDLPWNPMRIEQRIGRIHRMGQVNDVYIYNFSAARTIEAQILNILDAKINMFQLVVGEMDMILGNLKEKKDFEDLVMEIWAGSEDDLETNQKFDQLGDSMVQAKEHYHKIKDLDDRLLGELLPYEE